MTIDYHLICAVISSSALFCLNLNLSTYTNLEPQIWHEGFCKLIADIVFALHFASYVHEINNLALKLIRRRIIKVITFCFAINIV